MHSHPSERRRSPRITRRAKIQFDVNDGTHEGIIQNLSELGMHIQSTFLPELSDEISIPLPLLVKDNPPILHGKIVWFRASNHPFHTKHSFGVSLSATPTEYLQFVSMLGKEALSSPRGPKERFDAYRSQIFYS